MKRILKLHIVFILILSGSAAANSLVKGLNNIGSSFVLKSQLIYSEDVLASQNSEIIPAEQTTGKTLTKTYASSYNAPEFYGGFENYFSAQFILPDIRIEHRFSKQLLI